MTTSARARADWPAEGLERVERCPACGSADRTLLYGGVTDRSYRSAPGQWDVHRCRACGSAFLDPRPTSETIHLAYGNYYEDAVEGTDSAAASSATANGLRRLRRTLRNGYVNARYGYDLAPASRLGRLLLPLVPRQRAKADQLVRHLPAPSGPRRLLDVGCGEGEFVEQMAALGWAARGIDPSADAVEVARRRGIDVRQGDLATVELEEDAYAAITFRLVFEHIPEPVEALRACHRALRPGGVLWIAAPNFESDSSRAFGDAWIYLEVPRHAVLYTPASLDALLRRCGFAPVARHASGDSAWSFRLSGAIARGEPPFGEIGRLPLATRARAMLGDLRAQLRPERADVLVVVAEKR